MKKIIGIVLGVLAIIIIIVLLVLNANKDYDEVLANILKKNDYSYEELTEDYIKNSDTSVDEYNEEVEKKNDSEYYTYEFNMHNFSLSKNGAQYVDGFAYDYSMSYDYKTSKLTFTYRIVNDSKGINVIYKGSKNDATNFEMENEYAYGLDDTAMKGIVQEIIENDTSEFYTESLELIKSKKVINYIKEQ